MRNQFDDIVVYDFFFFSFSPFHSLFGFFLFASHNVVLLFRSLFFLKEIEMSHILKLSTLQVCKFLHYIDDFFFRKMNHHCEWVTHTQNNLRMHSNALRMHDASVRFDCFHLPYSMVSYSLHKNVNREHNEWRSFCSLNMQRGRESLHFWPTNQFNYLRIYNLHEWCGRGIMYVKCFDAVLNAPNP